MKLYLSFPPSVNSLYPGKERRHKSKKYEAWIKECGQLLLMQKKDYFDKPVQAVYMLGRPDNRIRDIENYAKAISDFLSSHGILKDDSLIHKLTMEWGDLTGCEITIEGYKPCQ